MPREDKQFDVFAKYIYNLYLHEKEEEIWIVSGARPFPILSITIDTEHYTAKGIAGGEFAIKETETQLMNLEDTPCNEKGMFNKSIMGDLINSIIFNPHCM